MPCNLLPCGKTPLALMTCPANSTLDPISNFFWDNMKLRSLHRWSRAWIREVRISIVGAEINISSTNFRTPGRLAMTSSDRLQNSSELADKPIGATRCLKRPHGKRKVVSLALSSSSGT